MPMLVAIPSLISVVSFAARLASVQPVASEAVCPAENAEVRSLAEILLKVPKHATELTALGVDRDVAKLRALSDDQARHECQSLRDALKEELLRWDKYDYVFYQVGDRYVVVCAVKRPPIPEGHVFLSTAYVPVAILDDKFNVLRIRFV
jgi:hypothetical protein